MSVDYTIPKDEVRAGQFEIDGDVFVRVVRCRDCAKAEFPEVYLLNGMKQHILTCVRFPSFQHETQPDGFCAWGERREP